jgi:hypothetical protein
MQTNMIECNLLRFNRTLKEKMWRFFSQNQTHKYINVLQDLIDSYNNTYHRSIKTSPALVTKLNEDEIWQNLYGFDKNLGNPKSIHFKFDVGDKVRISKAKLIFDKVINQFMLILADFTYS